MKKQMEKISILALSLVLTTGFSVSSALPYMFDFYKGVSTSQVELLISLPSFGIMLSLFLNGVLERYLSERQMIIIGLVVLSVAGTLPFFIQSYPFVFGARFIFGMGVGFINAKAISIISQRYQGKERIQTLGYRGSAEVVGTALLTLCAGQLMQFGWTAAFLVYAAGLVVLIFFLLFVPYEKQARKPQMKLSVEKMTRENRSFTFYLAFVSAVIVCSNIAVNLRIPSIIVYDLKMNHETVSLLLSAMQLIGIVAGMTFAFLVEAFKHRLLTVIGSFFGLTLVGIGLTHHLSLLSVATILSGFTYSIALTSVFQIISENIPTRQLNQATSIVVLGCSFGAAITPFVLQLIQQFSQKNSFLFLVLGGAMILTAISAYPILRPKHS